MSLGVGDDDSLGVGAETESGRRGRRIPFCTGVIYSAIQKRREIAEDGPHVIDLGK
jgi:hypothetical protein